MSGLLKMLHMYMQLVPIAASVPAANITLRFGAVPLMANPFAPLGNRGCLCPYPLAPI